MIMGALKFSRFWEQIYDLILEKDSTSQKVWITELWFFALHFLSLLHLIFENKFITIVTVKSD